MNKIKKFNYQEWWKGLNNGVKKEIITKLYGIEDQNLPPTDIGKKAENYTGDLNFTCKELENISFIEPFINLKILYLDENKISDIYPLKNLTQLEDLGLNKNNISDITPLKNLTRLTELYLSQNNISDISPLENLTKLKYLNLATNLITEQQLENLEKARPYCEIVF